MILEKYLNGENIGSKIKRGNKIIVIVKSPNIDFYEKHF